MTDIGQMVRSANPVPTGTNALADDEVRDFFLLIDQRSGEMQTQEATQPTSKGKKRRPGWAVAAAAFVAVVVVGAIGLAIANNNDAEPEVATPVDDSAEALVVVESAYESFNTGDAEGWLTAIWPHGVENNELVQYGAVYAALVAADASIDPTCSSEGYGDWEAVSDDGSVVSGYLVVCQTKETNAFYRADGIETQGVSRWVVADGATVANSFDSADFEESDAFSFEFRNWLVVAHKDASFDYEYFPWLFPVADSVPIAVQYVDEFVAQSPDWPRP